MIVKKILIVMLIGVCSILAADSIISAKDAKSVTASSTKVLYKKLLSSTNGKTAYNGLKILFNKKISKIASGGYYNSYVITYMNEPKRIKELLKPLSKINQDAIRGLIIKDLQAAGYTITYNKFWNNPDSFNITVSW